MVRTATKNRRGRSSRRPAPNIALKRAAPITLDHLPPDVTRHRILSTAEAAQFCRISVPHWRRLYRTGKVPKPIRLGTRKYGWKLSALLELLDECAV
jgi:predicted DNA-binding transcriptional regulator AlpA